ADLPVIRGSEREYHGSVDDPRISRVSLLRPQEIPGYVEEGFFDLGITGRDWIEETGAEVVKLAELPYSKRSEMPVRIVLAVAGSMSAETAAEVPPGARISTEYPNLTRRFFEGLGIPVKVFLSFGATEAKVPEIVDAVVDVTETGSTLRRQGMKILETLLTSTPELIANAGAFADPAKRAAMEEVRTLLLGAIDARGKVLVKLNVANGDLERVLAVLPAMTSPTISALAQGGYHAVETVVAKASINTLIPALKSAGARDILEIAINKIVA
ncbi:MAG: ATP phosphoribosyltransferase, partial [Actinomycetota bacterium]